MPYSQNICLWMGVAHVCAQEMQKQGSMREDATLQELATRMSHTESMEFKDVSVGAARACCRVRLRCS